MRNVYLRLAIPTVLVCVVAAGGLAATYAATKDKIAEQDRLNQEKALRAALPDATAFEELDSEQTAAAGKAAGGVTVSKVFEALDEGEEAMGWGIVLGSRGYGPMTLVVGVDRNGKVTGVTMVSHIETPGLGTKVVANPDYLRRFKGLDSPEKAVKLDAVTGATKSSNGVKKAAEAALLVYRDVLSKGGAAQ